jgi:hypothetical protein
MDCSFDEEVLLCADSIVAESDADATACEPRVDETWSSERDAGRIDAWARHAHAANGFGA